MSTFEKVRIKELGRIITGNTPVSTDETNYGGKYPFIKPTDMVIDQKHVFEHDETYSEKSYQRFIRSYIPKGATGVVTIGTVGEKMFQAHEDCFTNQSVNCIISDDKYFDKDYIYYLMKFNLPKVKGANPGTASGRHHVSKSNFSSIKIDVTKNLKTQQKIAKILSNYDDLIENNLKRIKLLEESARLTYEEWFLRFRIDGKKLEIDPDTKLPFGWELVKVGSLLQRVGSTAKIKSSEILESGTNPVVDQSTDFIAGYTNETNINQYIDNPFIVFGDHTRILKFVNFSFARGADGTQILISNNSRMPQTLFYHSLIAVDLSNYHYARHFKFLKEEKIILPKEDIATKYNDRSVVIFSQVKNLRHQNQLLKEARDILLPRLMTGMIDTNDMDIAI